MACCPRCNSDNYHVMKSVCYDCKEALGKMWNQIHREVTIQERKKLVKIEYKRTKHGYVKVTSYKDNITASEGIELHEYRKGIQGKAFEMAEKRRKELDDNVQATVTKFENKNKKKLIQQASDEFADTIKKRQDNIITDLAKDKKKTPFEFWWNKCKSQAQRSQRSG